MLEQYIEERYAEASRMIEEAKSKSAERRSLTRSGRLAGPDSPQRPQRAPDAARAAKGMVATCADIGRPAVLARRGHRQIKEVPPDPVDHAVEHRSARRRRQTSTVRLARSRARPRSALARPSRCRTLEGSATASRESPGYRTAEA